MNTTIDVWKMLAGVAFFLLAMDFIETSLHALAGRNFKLFLRNQLSNKFKAISSSAIVTGLLQSSSIVNALILGFVGTGIIQMENALALLLGSNFGTTLDSWLVVTFGFKYNIDKIVLPVAGITGILMFFNNPQSKIYLWTKLLFSISFLFIALGFIKSGMEAFVKQTDLTIFLQYPLIVFLFVGFILTLIVQSSSVTIALALSALYTKAINLPIAMCIVLGSEVGTTIKLFLLSAKGIAIKKRIALGNFLMNTITVFIMFILLHPLEKLITDFFKVKSELLALVIFQSIINIMSIIIFLPFLKKFGNFLNNRFVDNDEATSYISKVGFEDVGIALEALEKEIKIFIQEVLNYSSNSFQINENELNPEIETSKKYKTPDEHYLAIKHLHGEMHSFYLKLINISTNKLETERLDQLINSVRNIMFAAKNINDAQEDILQLKNSSNDVKFQYYLNSKEKLKIFYTQLISILNNTNQSNQFNLITNEFLNIKNNFTVALSELYKEGINNHVDEVEITTFINYNREIYNSLNSLLIGIKDYLLTSEASKKINSNQELFY